MNRQNEQTLAYIDIGIDAKNRIHRQKIEALKTFIEVLLSTPLKDRVAKIILFGSTAKGEADKESDIDVMVFATSEIESMRDKCAEIALDVAIKKGESVEPLVYPLTRYYYPGNLFMYNSLCRGKEVYSMRKEEIKEAEIEGTYKLASDYLRVAEYVFKNDDYRQAADLAYNALETTVKTLLLFEMDELPRTHSGTINRFGDLYVKTGKVSKELGKDIRRSLEIRNRARYDWNAYITEKEASKVISIAKELIKQMDYMRRKD